jgi:hypothetical protein
VAGRRPFSRGDASSGVPAERWPQLVEAPAALDAKIPAAVAEPIMACLRRDPAQRPTPAELGAQLERVLDALPGPKLSKLKPRRRR